MEKTFDQTMAHGPDQTQTQTQTTPDRLATHPGSPASARTGNAAGASVRSPSPFDSSTDSTSPSVGSSNITIPQDVSSIPSPPPRLNLNQGRELPEIMHNRIGAPLVRQERPPPTSAKTDSKLVGSAVKNLCFLKPFSLLSYPKICWIYIFHMNNFKSEYAIRKAPSFGATRSALVSCSMPDHTFSPQPCISSPLTGFFFR